MINRTFFVTVATRWIPTLYSILCPYEAAKILCPALCFLVMCQCMTAGDGNVSKRTSFGPGLVHCLRKGLSAISQPPKKLHSTTAFAPPHFQPCLAVLCWFAAFPRPSTSHLRQQHGAVEQLCVLEWLLERFLLSNLFSKPSSAPSLAPQAIFLHYLWLRQPKQVLQQY